MAKDYAKYFSTTKPARNVWVDGLLVAVLGLLISGLLYAAYLHKHNSVAKQQFAEWTARIKIFFHPNKHVIDNQTADMQPVVHQNAEPPIRFDFYTALPNMQIQLNQLAPHPDTPRLVRETPKSVTEPRYFLELGTFKSQAAASQMRLSLLLAGVDAVVVKIPGKNRALYCLQQGSFTDKQQAHAALLELQKKGVIAIIKKA